MDRRNRKYYLVTFKTHHDSWYNCNTYGTSIECFIDTFKRKQQKELFGRRIFKVHWHSFGMTIPYAIIGLNKEYNDIITIGLKGQYGIRSFIEYTTDIHNDINTLIQQIASAKTWNEAKEIYNLWEQLTANQGENNNERNK